MCWTPGHLRGTHPERRGRASVPPALWPRSPSSGQTRAPGEALGLCSRHMGVCPSPLSAVQCRTHAPFRPRNFPSSQDTGHGAAWNIPGSVDPMAKSSICAVESGRWWLVNVVFKTGESPSLKASMKDRGSPRIPRPDSAGSSISPGAVFLPP